MENRKPAKPKTFGSEFLEESKAPRVFGAAANGTMVEVDTYSGTPRVFDD